MGLDRAAVQSLEDSKVADTLPKAINRCHMAPVDLDNLIELPPWTATTGAVAGANGEPLGVGAAGVKKALDQQFSLQEKMGSSDAQGRPGGMPADPVMRRAYEEGGIFLEARIMLSYIGHLMQSNPAAINNPYMFMLKGPKDDFGIAFELMEIKVAQANGENVPVLLGMFSWRSKADIKGGNSDPYAQHVNRRVAHHRGTAGNIASIESEFTTDAVKLLAHILDHNAERMPVELRKQLLRKWKYPQQDSKWAVPTFITPLQVLSDRAAGLLLKKTRACPACAKDLSAAAKKCGACLAVAYCGVDCQRAHWKTHKKVCSKAEADVTDFSGDKALVVLHKPAPGMEGMVSAVISSRGGPRNANAEVRSTDAELPAMPATGFIIKVQVPLMGPGALCIYPRGKKFTTSMSADQPNFRRLTALVRKRGLMGGYKMYLWAKRVDARTLLVCTVAFPDQNQNW